LGEIRLLCPVVRICDPCLQLPVVGERYLAVVVEPVRGIGALDGQKVGERAPARVAAELAEDVEWLVKSDQQVKPT
jgi:hypothetical protein